MALLGGGAAGEKQLELSEGGTDRWGVAMRTWGTLADHGLPDLNTGMRSASADTGNMGAWEKPSSKGLCKVLGSLGQPWEDSEEADPVFGSRMWSQNSLESDHSSATHWLCELM